MSQYNKPSQYHSVVTPSGLILRSGLNQLSSVLSVEYRHDLIVWTGFHIA